MATSDNFEIVFTELRDTAGSIHKKICVNPDGTLTKQSDANVYAGVAKTIRMPASSFVSYLDSLSSRADTCLVPTVWSGGDDWDEYDITTEGNEQPENGLISRTSRFFQYLNSDSISLMVFDFDSGYNRAEVDRFLSELQMLLSDAIIGSTTKVMRFEKPSSSARVAPKGSSSGSDLPVNREWKGHIYIPVKNLTSELLKLIFDWAWLEGWKSHKVTKAGTIVRRSIIDPTVASPGRLMFEADPEVSGSLELVELVDRKCDYYTGGALDCEISCAILGDMTAQIGTLWNQYKLKIESDPDVIVARATHKAELHAKLLGQGWDKKRAERAAGLLYSDLTILSSDVILKSDGTQVSVYDILVDRDSWIGQKGFQDYISPKPGKNRAMIVGDENSVRLKSFAHGEVFYQLRFDFDGLMRWLSEADPEEIAEIFGSYAAQAVLTEIQLDLVVAEAKKTVKGTTAKAFKDSLKSNSGPVRAAVAKDEIEASGGTVLAFVSQKSTHGEIAEDTLQFLGNCRYYGGKMYVADRCLWRHMREESIGELISLRYAHCDLCKRASDYRGIGGLVISKDSVFTEEWVTPFGIPCASRFLQVGPSVRGDVRGMGEEPGASWTDYSLDLGCRFKLKFNPDPSCPTPYWNKILANVANVDCFQQAFGLALCGYLTAGAQSAAVFFGKGGTGKGTTNAVLSAMLPRGRVTNISIEQMSDPKQVVDLSDSVVNFIAEIRNSRKAQITEGFKMATGGDHMNGWRLWKGPFRFKPTASQIININEWPVLDSAGTEMRRRLGHFIIRFDKNYSDDEKIENMDRMIIEHELPGVLAWAIAGIVSYFRDGAASDLSLQLWDRWIGSFDPLEAFIKECCVIDSSNRIKRAALWAMFEQWMSESEYLPLRKGHFFDRIIERFGNPIEVASEMWIQGLNASNEGRNVAARAGVAPSKVGAGVRGPMKRFKK